MVFVGYNFVSITHEGFWYSAWNMASIQSMGTLLLISLVVGQ